MRIKKELTHEEKVRLNLFYINKGIIDGIGIMVVMCFIFIIFMCVKEILFYRIIYGLVSLIAASIILITLFITHYKIKKKIREKYFNKEVEGGKNV